MPLLFAVTPFAALHYREIGPAIGGGRTTAIVSSERDPRRYYVGTADGGVFGSTDGGYTWRPLFDRMPSAAIGALALDPRDPRDLWVGTGEANPRNTVEAGDGVWRTRDGGQTWRHLGLVDSSYISSILLDPQNENGALAGVLGDVFAPGGERGVYLTRDGGAHWKRTLAVGPTSGVSNLARVPDNPQMIFAGVWEVRRTPWTLSSGGRNGGLYRSTDGGRTWERLRGHGLPDGATGRIGIATGTRGLVYAVIESRVGNVWRSRDYGQTWAKMPRSTMIGARPFYFSRLFVDPSNNNRVISVGGSLSMSNDGAQTFLPIASNTGYDYHDVWWSRDGKRLAAALDGGVILSADGGQTWNQPYTLPIAQLYHIGIDDTLPYYQVCVGLQDNNSWCGVSSSTSGVGVLNRDWQLIAPGDGMWSLFDPSDRDRVYSTEMNTSTGQVYATDLRTHQAREISPDSETTLGKAAADLRYRFNWETPIAFEGDANQKLLLGGNVVFGTRDGGANWSVMSPDLTRNDRSKQGPSGGPITHDMTGAETYDTILDIAPSPIQSLDVWVSTDDGLVQLTRDGGLTWSNITPANVPEWSRIDCVEPSYHLEGRAYIALDRHMNGDTRPYIYQTDDYGAHWRKISSGIPNDLFVRVIREDPINSVLFAGTQRGVWFSTDDGKHWSSLRLNMPASAVYDIAIQRRRHDLIVATYGRGLWILDDMRPVEELPSSTLPVIYIPQPAYRMWRWSPIQSFPGGIQSNVFAGESAPYGAILTFLAPKAAHARVEILKSDRVVRHIDLGVVNPGLHRVVWDLNEDGPTQWLGTYPDNRGPTEGAESLPGVYTVRLFLGSDKLDGTFSVRPDPRDIGAIGRYAERYSTLNTLYRDLDVVDKILNRIGPAEGKRRGLTSDPQFYEGVTVAPPGLREEIQDLLGRLSSAYQAPTAAQLQQLNSIDERVKALR